MSPLGNFESYFEMLWQTFDLVRLVLCILPSQSSHPSSDFDMTWRMNVLPFVHSSCFHKLHILFFHDTKVLLLPLQIQMGGILCTNGTAEYLLEFNCSSLFESIFCNSFWIRFLCIALWKLFCEVRDLPPWPIPMHMYSAEAIGHKALAKLASSLSRQLHRYHGDCTVVNFLNSL